MTANRLRTLLVMGLLATGVTCSAPVRAQMSVFDFNNYSQNVLTAARTLQQVNNGIQSLQNEAMSLLNQARNLASLPYLVVGAAPAIDRAKMRSNSSVRPSASPTMSPRSTRLSAAPIRKSTAPRPPRRGCSPTPRRGGKTRWPASRTPCASRPVSSAISIAHALRSMPWCHQASPRRARCRRRSPATSSSLSRPTSSPT